jgi:hypothetical protein
MIRTLTPRPRRRTAPGLLVLAGSLALALSGVSACGPTQLGTAAIIDGHTVTVHDLQKSTQGYLAAVPDAQPGEAQRGILQQLIVLDVIDKAALKARVHVTAGEVATQRDRVFASVRTQAAAAKVSERTFVVRELARGQQPAVVAPDILDDWIRGQILANKVGTATAAPDGTTSANAFIDAAKATHVKVNPRYGRWDPKKGLSPLVSGGLSKTAEELAAGTATP